MEEMVREVVAEEQESKLGVTSIEKIPKISVSGQNFLNPSPPLRKKALLTKMSVFCNYKVHIFSKFKPRS